MDQPRRSGRAMRGPGPFFEGMPEPALVLDGGGVVLAANPAFDAAFGRAPGAVIGRPAAELVAPAGRAALASALALPDRAARIEAAVLGAHGEAREAAWSLSGAGDGTRFAVLREVAEERRRRDAVERMTGACSWETDPGGGVGVFSPGAREILGVDPTVLPREERLAVYVGDGRRRIEGALARLEADGTPFDVEVEVRPPGGADRWVRVTGAAVMRAGRPVRLHGTLHDVTEERAARSRLERLGAVARLTTSGVMVHDRDGLIEWVNEAFTVQTGYALEEVRGRPASMLDSPHVDPAALRVMAAAVAERRPHRVEVVNRRRDGREIHVELDAQPMTGPDGEFTGWMSVRTDVTARREAQARAERAEREARESRQQLLTAIEALEDGFVLYDHDDRMVVCNARYKELYAPSAHAMVPGATFESILRAGLENGQYLDGIGCEEEWLARRLADHRASGRTLEQSLPDDRWLRVVERPTPDGGRVGLRVDVTELKRQQRATAEALRGAEAASAAKSAFLATMSHEIRTPMNGILGLADVLADGPLEAEQARVVRDIRESGEALLTILNDVLDVSKIEAGRLTLEAIAFEPRELARRMRALYAPVARERGLELAVEAGPGPARLGDPGRIAQVLGNLVSNAVKFTERGRVALRVLNPPDGPLRVEVEDSGIGMTEAEAGRVFERFAQADDSVTRRFGGTGLGLSIVQGLVEAMGGRVEVDSAPGRGTRFAVTLPLPPAERAAERPAAEGPATDLAGLRVLAADDNATNRRVVAKMLERLGAEAVVVDSGQAAVEAAVGATGAGGFDLLLLDISMPGMDGVEALRRIGEGARGAGRRPAPALAVTANVLDEQVRGYLAAGFAGHLAKPLRLAALAEAGRRLAAAPAE